MEDVSSENNSNKKRARNDSDLNTPDSDQANPEDSEVNSPEAKRIRQDLLELLGDSDTVTEREPAIQDLDSVIRSFEEEILHRSPQQPPVLYQSSDSGESQPELGYLLEASDDELGLPPTIAPSGEQTNNEQFDLRPVAPPEAVGFGEIMGFEDKMRSYDSFEFGIFEEIQGSSDINSEFVTLGGLQCHE
ncbi:hypothetical protein F0562_025180 [Nyssa sinensis]|uniref:Uncharacterized protein n=1 Tax=Nyssa sinensis TaxID=561372 RepID=A0A5J5BDQ4_9ASTE|nr:hypothetical protein F0562_025180 [Nyssa sinensis]